MNGTFPTVADGKYVAIYNNTAGIGQPLFVYQAAVDNVPTLTTGIGQLPSSLQTMYGAGGASGQFPGVLPIGLANGVNNISAFNANGTLFASATDVDGTWPSGSNANSVSPTRREEIVISNINLLAPQPTTGAGIPALITATTSSLNISFTGGNGEGRLVVARAGSAPTAGPMDQTAYTANAAYGAGDALGNGFVVYNGTGASFTMTGLNPSTSYFFDVYEFNGTGSVTNYVVSPASNNFSTSAPSGSQNSDVIVLATPNSNLDYAAFQAATIAVPADAIVVGEFQLRDGAGAADADLLSTEITSITFQKGASNTVTSWANTIRTAALIQGGVVVATTNVVAESITFTGVSLVAADGANLNFELALTFETAATDNQQFQFAVSNANVTANGSGSLFTAFTTFTSTTADLNRIEVNADRVDAITTFQAAYGTGQPTTFNFQAEDVNGNRDLDHNGNFDANSSTNNISGEPLTVNVSNGVGSFVFTFLNANAVNTVQIDGNTPNLTSYTSPAFAVNLPDFQEIIFPQYLIAKDDAISTGTTNGQRTPSAAYVKLNNLTPGGVYRFNVGIIDNLDGATSNGAGTFALPGITPAGTTINAGTTTTQSAIADANGSITLWVYIYPSTNGRFAIGKDVNLRIGRTAAGGSTIVARTTSFLTFRMLDGASAGTVATTDDAGFVDAQLATTQAGLPVFFYDNMAGSGRPLSGGYVENDGYNLTAPDSNYYSNIDGIAGRAAGIVNVGNVTGVRNITTYDLAGTVNTTLTDANGIWNSTNHPANTTNLAKRDIACIGLDYNIAISVGNSVLCEGDSATLSVQNIGAGYTFQWFLNTDTIQGATLASFKADSAGAYTVTINNGNCEITSNIVTLTNSVTPNKNVSVMGSQAFCGGGSATLTSAAANVGIAYQWRRNGINIPSATNQSYVATLTGNYTVRMTLGSCATISNTVQISDVAPVSTFPYRQNFEGASGWVAGGQNSSWERGTPAKAGFMTAARGARAWVTSLTGSYNNMEASYVESPCFDFSGFTTAPYFGASIWWNSENDLDGAVLQYSTNGGLNWTTAGSFGTGTNWYNSNTGNVIFGSIEKWSGSAAQGSNGWVRAQIQLPGALVGQASVKFRFAFQSDASFIVADGGFAFDDVAISATLPALTQLRAQDCNRAAAYSQSEYVLADAVAGASEYIFNFNDGTNDYQVTSQVAGVQFNSLAFFQYNTTYSVNVYALANGIIGVAGPACTIVTVPQPVSTPATQLRSSDCGYYNYTLLGNRNYVGADAVAGASDYEFEFTNTSNNLASNVISTRRFVTLNGNVAYGTTYNVRVRAIVDGVAGSYGVACPIAVIAQPSAPAGTQLRNQDCGASVALNGYIIANQVAGASSYTFNFFDATGGTTLVTSETTTGSVLNLGTVTGLTANTTYFVTVDFIIEGSFEMGADTCQLIITPATPRLAGASSVSSAMVYPNPTADQVILEGDDIAAFTISDLSGRTVTPRSNFTGRAVIGSELAAGVYNISLEMTNGAIQSLRFVKTQR